jgi:hypothetical protein
VKKYIVDLDERERNQLEQLTTKGQSGARKIRRARIPKHACWLKQVEIELSALWRQCLSRRIPEESTLKKQSGTWESERNEQEATVRWRFQRSRCSEEAKAVYPPRS